MADPTRRTRSARRKRARVLARYVDSQGRPHRILLSGRLVVDVQGNSVPRLVAALSEDEGEPQAIALLEGSEIDEGFLARARREPGPFFRRLESADLNPVTGDSTECGDESLAA